MQIIFLSTDIPHYFDYRVSVTGLFFNSVAHSCVGDLVTSSWHEF